MSIKEDTIRQLQTEVDNNLKEISDSLSKVDLSPLNTEIDNRLIQSNTSFLEEIKSLSLVTVTAAPFSLTLLLSGLNIEKTFLVASFSLLMLNVTFLNIGVWYINNRFRTSTASQKLEAISMEMETSSVLNVSKDSTARLNALVELMHSQARLKRKKTFEPYEQEKILKLFKDWGLVFLSVGILLIVLSVGWALVPDLTKSTS